MAAVPSPLPPFSLRPAEAGDFDAYMDAFESVAAEGRWMGAEAPLDRDARRTGFDRALEGHDAVLYLADAGGTVVGSIFASIAGGVVDLGMFVVSGHRGAGVGSALLEAVIDWARSQEAHKISLAVWPSNHPAIGLYARYGFRVEGTRRRHYRRRSGALWDAVWMGRILDHDTPGGPGPSTPERPSIVVPEDGIRGLLGIPAATGAGAGRAAARPDGGAIVLRGWRRADIPALAPLLDDPEIRRTLPHIPDPYTTADAEEYVASTRVNLTAGTAMALAIVVDGELAGSIDLRLAGPDSGSGEIGYWVAAPARRRGVASTATRLVSDFGFEALGLQRVELNAEVTNVASRRTAERAGFELEGVRRAWRNVRGVPTDFALYARIAPTP
jgi:RimJ/RimL family protein N-acetyltransferase